MEFVTIVVSVFLFYTFIRAISPAFGVGKPRNLPPGPIPLPLIGNLLLLGDQPHRSLAKLSEIHGPIMSLKLGCTNTLVISSASAAKEVLQKQDLAFSSRQIPDALTAHNQSQFSVIWLPAGTQWRTLRRLLNSNIFSGSSLDANQQLRSQKVHELVEYCHRASRSKEAVDIGRAAFRTSLNLISNTIFSKDLTDPYVDSGKEFKELVGRIMVEAGRPNVVDFFPVLRRMDPQGVRRRMRGYFEKAFEVFEDLINERLMGMTRSNYKQEDDLLDVFLKMSEEKPHEINRTHVKSLFLVRILLFTNYQLSTLT